jgi:hypothetical protein
VPERLAYSRGARVLAHRLPALGLAAGPLGPRSLFGGIPPPPDPARRP